jgi:hypothetical protein
MVRFVGFQNGHLKDTLHDKIEVCVQYIDTILGSIIYTSERACAIVYRRCCISSVIILLPDRSQSYGEHLYRGLATGKTPIIKILNRSHMKLSSPHPVHLDPFRTRRNPCVFVEAAKRPWMRGR